GLPAEVVVADGGDHGDACAEAGGEDGLVTALAAEAGEDGVAGDGLAGAGQAGGAGGEGGGGAAAGGDVGHGGTSGRAALRTAAKRCHFSGNVSRIAFSAAFICSMRRPSAFAWSFFSPTSSLRLYSSTCSSFSSASSFHSPCRTASRNGLFSALSYAQNGG